MVVAFSSLGLGGTRPRDQTAADHRRWGPHAGHGATCGPSGRAGVGARLCAVVPHRWLQGVYDGAADTLRPVGPACAPAGTRPYAETALDASARAALCAGGQDRAASPSGPREVPGRVRHAGRYRAGPAAHGWHINTAFIERVNLTIRQHVAAVGRRVMTLCKGEAGLHQQLAVYHTYYNFCLPHASLRQPLPQPEPTNGTGSARLWRPRTPA